MTILDNEKVREFFGCGEDGHNHDSYQSTCESSLAQKVLSAMQEPIGKGERFLGYEPNSEWVVDIADDDNDKYHPHALRLPDRFQKKECGCGNRTATHLDKCPLSAVVEERIKEIARMEMTPTPTVEFMEDVLRDYWPLNGRYVQFLAFKT